MRPMVVSLKELQSGSSGTGFVQAPKILVVQIRIKTGKEFPS
jgi:hypothetical protein